MKTHTHELIADGLAATGVAIVHDCLDAETVDALRVRALECDASGALVPARVGRGDARAADPAVRGDRILWLDRSSAMDRELAFLDAMDTLRDAFNRHLMLGLVEFECHYALYPPGTGYARHRDRFRDDDTRVVSCVLYLNEAWREADGGALRLHLDAQTRRDVMPQGGTLVIFLSESFEHEVLPATRSRLALTGWFRRRAC